MKNRSTRASETMVDIGQIRRSARLRAAATLCTLLTMNVVGCGDATLVPVVGQVKLDGKPVAECAVLFVPVAGGAAASGTTDADGRFHLATTNRPSVAIGDYAVTITKQNVTDIVNKATGDHRLQIDWLTPQEYSRPETSGIRKTVSTQEHEFVFELTSK